MVSAWWISALFAFPFLVQAQSEMVETSAPAISSSQVMSIYTAVGLQFILGMAFTIVSLWNSLKPKPPLSQQFVGQPQCETIRHQVMDQFAEINRQLQRGSDRMLRSEQAFIDQIRHQNDRLQPIVESVARNQALMVQHLEDHRADQQRTSHGH
jgi:hypothetical protein